ncbi:MAG: hypothetical protein ACLTQH_03185 [Fusobacterium sp.]|uniref:hypothetical protein n=1 Tax=Fusobacterium sp. SB021 TaxID=2744227 RepID=UPI001D895C03|nr:hypothetical protein [Fusobacterium sp.]
MTFEELIGFNGQPVTEEQLEEIRECDLVEDIDDIGLSPMYPELHWYIITLTNRQEINVFA